MGIKAAIDSAVCMKTTTLTANLIFIFPNQCHSGHHCSHSGHVKSATCQITVTNWFNRLLELKYYNMGFEVLTL
jgi:hypothetical protein